MNENKPGRESATLWWTHQTRCWIRTQVSVANVFGTVIKAAKESGIECYSKIVESTCSSSVMWITDNAEMQKYDLYKRGQMWCVWSEYGLRSSQIRFLKRFKAKPLKPIPPNKCRLKKCFIRLMKITMRLLIRLVCLMWPPLPTFTCCSAYIHPHQTRTLYHIKLVM